MSLHINIPENLQLSQFELRMMLASKLFEKGLITSGQGAKMVGVSKKTFIELLSQFEVSIFQYNIDEIEDDLRNDLAVV